MAGRGPIVLELEKIRSFVTVAARGSLARAAPELFVSTSGLSRRIHDLEKELGVELLERSMRGVVLTPAGEEILEHANRIIAACDDLFACASSQASGDVSGRTIQIGIAPGVFFPFRDRLLDAVREVDGTVAGRLDPDSNTRLIRKLIVGELDLALLHQRPMAPEVRSIQLLSQPTMVCLASYLPQASKDPLTLADLASLPFVTSSALNSGTPIYYARLRSIFEEAGICRFVDVGSFDTYAMEQHIVGGSGFGIAFEGLVWENVIVRRVSDLDINMDTWLAWGVKATGDRIVRHAIDAMKVIAGVPDVTGELPASCSVRNQQPGG
jgi:DNA-binding transcriptional LysR family regulator